MSQPYSNVGVGDIYVLTHILAKEVPDEAHLRELLQNSKEAGATEVLLDPWWPELLEDRDTKWDCAARPRQTTKGQDLGQKVRWLWLTGADSSHIAPPTPSPKVRKLKPDSNRLRKYLLAIEELIAEAY